MLYQALSGQLPYLGTPYQVLLGKQTEAPPPIASLNPQAPADLVALAMELLAINPKERPLGRDVLRRLGTAVHALPPPAYGRGAVAARAPLYGRSDHLAALRGAFVAAKDQPVVVHLSGAPGMGKTALAQHFLAELEREGSAIVLAGRCFEAEQLAFKAVDHPIDSLSRSLRRLSLVELEALLPPDVVALAQLFPVLERVDVIQQLVQEAPKKGYPRAAAFAALRNLFYQLARKRRVVCFLDDLQFGDQDSAELLAQLLAPPRPPPFLLIAAYPSSERDRQEILRVLRAPKNSAFVVREILVGALSQAAAEELARSVLKEHGDPSEDDERPGEQIRTTMPAFPPAELRARARAIAREAEGHPLFVHEMALDAKHELQGGHEPGPSSIHQVLLRRYAAVAPPAKRLLEILAVGGPLPRRVARHAAALEAKDAATIHQLEILRLARVRPEGSEDALECEDDRVATTVRATLSAEQLAEVHRQIAEALTAVGAAPERILPHLAAAGRTPANTEELSRVVSGRDDSHTDVSGGADDPLASQARFSAKRAKAEVLAAAGQKEAGDLFLEASQLAPTVAEQRELKRRAADLYLRSGRVELGLTILRPLLRQFSFDLPRDAEAALTMLRIERSRLLVRGLEPASPPIQDPELNFEADLCWTVGVGLTFVDVVTAAIYTSRHLRLALELSDPGQIARGLAMELGFLTSEAAPSSTRIHRVLEALKRRAKEAEDPYVRGFAALGAGLAALHEGEWAQTVRCVENAEGLLGKRRTGADWELSTARTFGLWAEAYRGRFRGLDGRLGRLIEDALARGDSYTSTVLRQSGNATVIWLAADRPDQALAHLEAARQEVQGPSYPLAHFWETSSRTLLELYRGPNASAWRGLSKQWPLIERSQVLRVQVIRAEALFLRARAALAAASSAPSPRPLYAAARADADALEREGRRWSLALARLIQAEINRGLGLHQEAAEAYREAEAGFWAAGMQAHALAARYRLGELAGRGGRGVIAEVQSDLLALGVVSVERFLGLLSPVPK
jgi:hypothetical protein